MRPIHSYPVLRFTIGSLAVMAVSLAANRLLAASYTAIELGPEGVLSSAQAINASGVIVGASEVLHSLPHDPFLYSGGIMHDLMFSGIANDINDNGVIVGEDDDYFPTRHPFIYNNGTRTTLDDAQGITTGIANGINNEGQVVGSGFTVLYTTNTVIGGAFVYSGSGVVQYLNSLINPESGWDLRDAAAINDSGQIAGTGMINGDQHAFLFSDGLVQDLGTIPGAVRYMAHAMNSSGEVVGEADFPDNSSHAFLYVNGLMHDLGPGIAYGINAGGQVVGGSDPNFFIGNFLYCDGERYDLNDLFDHVSHRSLIAAFDINDAGDIVGIGGAHDAFLLRPIPEPSSIALAAVGLAGLAACAWRRRRR